MTDPGDTDALRHQRGWALVSTLWVLTLLAMMAAATQSLTLSSSRLEHRAWDEARIDAAVNAAVIRAVLALDDPRTDQRWRVDGVPQDFSFDGKQMQISIRDESGLIDVNNVAPDTVAALFAAAGVDAGTAKILAGRITDWREPVGDGTGIDDTVDQYAPAGLPDHARHGPFQTINELKLVPGISATLFDRIAPTITVYSRMAEVDQRVAPPAVLDALHSSVPDGTGQLSSGLQNQATPPIGNPPGLTTPEQSPPGIIPAGLTAAGRSFSISVVAYYKGRKIAHTIVLEPTGDSHRPYLVEAWR